ncbi:hypothetical protein LTR56_000720 [Elasticomyces elasticus]|nr:hypothetical protein LTR22_013593 [Elasticomyces elasticus]KAK3660344.1 hypothetical protein LTR56_000720 [Elasticomyces elasticus]KAK4929264.1 hypothetical protein LTR49_004161 [Elasticomyces elasticus]KAK5765820.1 hypothetical protein LTS12_004080 [Elasticomyces elasticus]
MPVTQNNPSMFGIYRNFNTSLNHVAPGHYIEPLRSLDHQVKSLQERIQRRPNDREDCRPVLRQLWTTVLDLENKIRGNRHDIMATQAYADAAVMCTTDVKRRLGDLGEWLPWMKDEFDARELQW